ncbi:alpha/beta fold hydrolase [Micromonospora sp. NPDC048999]|uniref:alpha/beta fold hydrolase n=1 Tax=Micromonospora sp. NPDC048999 TaxID=3155391 RepID=UPI003400CF06
MTVSHAEATTAIASVFKELLGLPVGPDDDFFDLGGYSLLVVDVVERSRAAGLTVTALDVYAHPTPAGLAHQATGPADEPDPIARTPGFAADLVSQVWRTGLSPWHETVPPSLVPLIPDGDGEPMVCVHLGTGHVRLFTHLAEVARGDRPVWGFEAIGYRAPVRPLLSIGETAERYLTELRVAQPRGPYHLSGLCAGGVIALEMAQRLRAEGEQVASLVLVDLPYGMPELDPGWGLTDHVDYLLGSLRHQFGLVDPVADLPAALAELKRRVWFEQETPEEDFYRLTVLWAAAQFAQEHYAPRQWDGPVTAIAPAERAEAARAYWLPLLPQAEVCETVENAMIRIVKDPIVAEAFVKTMAG